MGPVYKFCSFDGSELSPIGGEGSNHPPSLNVVYYFCPSCDVAFMVLDDRAAGGTLQALKWKREGREFRLLQEDKEGLRKLAQKQWKYHELNLFYGVRGFINRRNPPEPAHYFNFCPNDGMKLPLLGECAYDPQGCSKVCSTAQDEL